MLIEVPNLAESPFDILIADHCSHFSPRVLVNLVETAGFEVIRLVEGLIPKEISLLARVRNKPLRSFGKFTAMDTDDLAEGQKQVLECHLSWLAIVLSQAREFSNGIGIFGSSIAATWLASELVDAVRFFVDEDVARAGQLHLGLPIVSVDDVPGNTPVLMPLRPDIAQRVADRLNTDRKIQFVLPPRQGCI
jgi:hypothetical protein